MSIVGELLERIKFKRREVFATTTEQYENLIGRLARGEQADAETLANLLDALDKSDADFEQDVEAKQKRIVAAESIAELQKVVDSLPGLRAELKRRDDELNAFIAQKKPAIAAAAEALKNAEQLANQLPHEKTTLRTVGVPLALKERQAALKRRQMELRDIRDEYHSRTDDTARRLKQLLENERNLTARIESYAFGDSSKSQMTAELEAVRAEIPQRQEYLRLWDSLKQRADKLAAEIESEQREIELALMVP